MGEKSASLPITHWEQRQNLQDRSRSERSQRAASFIYNGALSPNNTMRLRSKGQPHHVRLRTWHAAERLGTCLIKRLHVDVILAGHSERYVGSFPASQHIVTIVPSTFKQTL